DLQDRPGAAVTRHRRRIKAVCDNTIGLRRADLAQCLEHLTGLFRTLASLADQALLAGPQGRPLGARADQGVLVADQDTARGELRRWHVFDDDRTASPGQQNRLQRRPAPMTRL